MMAKVFCQRMEDVLHIDRHVSLLENDPERIAPTIAHTLPYLLRNCFKDIRQGSKLRNKFLMAISTPGVGGGWYSGFQVTRIIKGFFGGSLSFRSLDLWGSVKVLQVFCFFSRDFNVCIKRPRNIYGLKIRYGICVRLNFGPGIFSGF